MHIAHIALWAKDLEALKSFYIKYFNGVSNEKYTNAEKQFESYFIRFAEGAALELMRKPAVSGPVAAEHQQGLTHIAFKLGSEEAVLTLTETLRRDGFKVVGEPRRTGDGYFESVILDVEGNRIELVG